MSTILALVLCYSKISTVVILVALIFNATACIQVPEPIHEVGNVKVASPYVPITETKKVSSDAPSQRTCPPMAEPSTGGI
mmetsp:Transcript_38301/g.51881  ORF Transcript_38301/g.51881 Transcript_38301/m.51881 type:complete len:80 (+) Transcript_38301:858-1097(+)